MSIQEKVVNIIKAIHETLQIAAVFGLIVAGTAALFTLGH